MAALVQAALRDSPRTVLVAGLAAVAVAVAGVAVVRHYRRQQRRAANARALTAFMAKAQSESASHTNPNALPSLAAADAPQIADLRAAFADIAQVVTASDPASASSNPSSNSSHSAVPSEWSLMRVKLVAPDAAKGLPAAVTGNWGFLGCAAAFGKAPLHFLQECQRQVSH